MLLGLLRAATKINRGRALIAFSKRRDFATDFWITLSARGPFSFQGLLLPFLSCDCIVPGSQLVGDLSIRKKSFSITGDSDALDLVALRD